MTLSLGSINLLERLPELRKTLYWLDWWCIGWGPKQKSFCACGAWGPVWWLMEVFWLPTLEALYTPPFWVFVEASLQKHDWLTRWPLVIDSLLRLSSLPEIHGWFLWPPEPLLTCFPKNQFHYHKSRGSGKGLVMKNKTPISPLWLRSDFRNWGQEAKLLY